MATPKWLDYMTGDMQAPPLDMNMRILAALAAIASGQNPDGTTSPSGETGAAINPANVLVGQIRQLVTTGAATLITVPAGRIWVGTVAISVTGSNGPTVTLGSSVIGTVASAGVGVIPTAGTILECITIVAANAAAGTTGSDSSNTVVCPFVVVAPAGNVVTLTLASTIGASTGAVDATASGLLQ